MFALVPPAIAEHDPVSFGLNEQDLLFDELPASASDEDETEAGLLLEQALRDLAALRRNPVDINAASVSELLRVPFLDPVTAVAIVAHRRESGPFARVEDLVQAGIDADTVAALRP